MKKKQPLLSILILSVLPRHESLKKLMFNLQRQIIKNKLQEKIEIVLYVDNFEKTVGEKTQTALDKCNGKYACGIGDDDEISDNYCEEIIKAIEVSEADHITFNVKVIDNEKDNQTRVECSIKNKIKPSYIWGLPSLNKGKFFGLIRGIKYYTHTLMVTKLEKTKHLAKFPFTNVGSDEKYYNEIYEKKLLKTEYKIDKTLYVYHMNHKKSLCHRSHASFNRVLARNEKLPEKFFISTEGINVLNIYNRK